MASPTLTYELLVRSVGHSDCDAGASAALSLYANIFVCLAVFGIRYRQLDMSYTVSTRIRLTVECLVPCFPLWSSHTYDGPPELLWFVQYKHKSGDPFCFIPSIRNELYLSFDIPDGNERAL